MIRLSEKNRTKTQEYHSGKKYSDSFPSSDKLTKTARTEAISKTLTDALTYSADANNADRGGTDLGTYIPSSQTLSGINSIRTPTIMFIMQSGDYTGEVSDDNIALTGIRTIHEVRTIGYRAKDGKLKYSWEWQGRLKNMEQITLHILNRRKKLFKKVIIQTTNFCSTVWTINPKNTKYKRRKDYGFYIRKFYKLQNGSCSLVRSFEYYLSVDYLCMHDGKKR